MIFDNLLLLLLALFLVALNGFFVAAEFALVKLRQTKVQELRSSRGIRGQVLARVHGQLDAYLSACQLGITLASLGLGWVGEPAFAVLLERPLAALGVADPGLVHTISFAAAFTLISYLHIVVGELAPKSMAIRKPEKIAIWTALPLYLFYWLMYPAIRLLNASANQMLRAARVPEGDAHGHETPYTRNELRSILHMSRPAVQESNPDLHNLITYALELPELEISDIMRAPRELVAFYTDDSYADVRRNILKHRFSRYPLIDHLSGDVLGVVHVKDVFAEQPGEDFQTRLRNHLLPLERVREHEPLLMLLRRFRQGAPHLAIVLDESDQLAGFLTLEDLMEAIFGEITDEHDARRTTQITRRIQVLKDGSLLMRGELPVFRLERELKIAIGGDQDVSTVAGLLTAKLGHLPQSGDHAEFEGFTLVAQRVSGNRVELVKVLLPAAEDDD